VEDRVRPFSLCERCRNIVHKWERVKSEYNKYTRKAWNIEPVKMRSDDLQVIANRISDIEESIHYIKRMLEKLKCE